MHITLKMYNDCIYEHIEIQYNHTRGNKKLQLIMISKTF